MPPWTPRFSRKKRGGFLFDSMSNQPSQGVSLSRQLDSRHVAPAFEVTRSIDQNRLVINFTPTGESDLDALISFVGPLSGYLTGFYLQPSGVFVSIPLSVAPLLVDLGVLQTNNGKLMAVTRGGAMWSIPWPFASWDYMTVLNGVFVLGAFPTTPIWLAGFDTAGSTYRDIQISIANKNDPLKPGVGALNWGEDLNTQTPSTSTITQNRATIITAMRNRLNGVPRGTMRQCGVATSIYFAENQGTSALPNRICVFGDPDGAGFGTAGNFCPAGFGFQEIIWSNSTTTINESAQKTIETSQSEHFGIPLTDPQGIALKPKTQGVTVNMPSTSTKMVAYTVGGLPQGFVTDNNGNYIIQ